MSIKNDQELKAALNDLTQDQQRILGARFTQSVIGLTDNPRLESALKIALDPQSDVHALNDAYKVAKSIATKTYTACGRDADWGLQAEHFIAAACAATLTPTALMTEAFNAAWKAAIQARMAKNCIMIESETGEVENEAEKQYQLTRSFKDEQ
ncbi:hypothetical protein [Sedimenticola selenatireducens]|uniref:Uncharacterized protein n=1 Tax=Sedimenticola selenatireducens TaxID=191960 RepID=A0A557SLR8_9GAMM|nr:hypothetical protein [Sedimenticola selenatireducens]TVO78371.1 hypothetical protein FHP88_01495 [Sedimenticola selenatireducens]TVT62771.1 MAG: hypothetical protein FHK78_13960 [Sedimenticola selenatireducens]